MAAPPLKGVAAAGTACMQPMLTLDASLLFLPMLDTVLPLMEVLAPEGRMAAPLKGLTAAEVMITPDMRAASPCRPLLAALTLHNQKKAQLRAAALLTQGIAHLQHACRLSVQAAAGSTKSAHMRRWTC